MRHRGKGLSYEWDSTAAAIEAGCKRSRDS